jgi:hypothetical protein
MNTTEPSPKRNGSAAWNLLLNSFSIYGFYFSDCPPEPVPAPFFPQLFLGNSCASFLQLSSVSTQEAAYAIVKDDERDELSFPLRLSQTFCR